MPLRIVVKRVYDEPAAGDGCRVLIDRLWPRGVRRDQARIDAWPKSLTPSPALRSWFHAHPDEPDRFRERYREELAKQTAAADELIDSLPADTLTLITATRAERQVHPAVLQAWLQERAAARRA